jgi:hypothetical protein
MAMRLQLTTGLDVLEEWAESASQAQRNIVYEALFAIGDGSVFLVHDIFADPADPGTFIIAVKSGLIMKVAIQRAECTFGIRYVGTVEDEVDSPSFQQEPSSSE